MVANLWKDPKNINMLFKDIDGQHFSPKKDNENIFHYGVKREKEFNDSELEVFKQKCLTILESESTRFLSLPLEMKLNNGSFCYTMPFFSDINIKDLNEEFKGEVYKEGVMPDCTK